MSTNYFCDSTILSHSTHNKDQRLQSAATDRNGGPRPRTDSPSECLRTQRTVGEAVNALHVEVDGSGPALVLMNGAGCTVRQWDDVVAELADSFTVVRHDVRGTGRSASGPADEYRFEVYADDVVGLCAERGIERFDLWGMAWGARVALVTAARHPDVVHRLVLSDLGIDPADVDAQKAGHQRAKAARAEAGMVETPRPAGAFEHDDPDTARAALAATFLHRDLMPFVELVTAPTLIATGEFDPNLVSSRRALAGFADARLEVLPLTAHGSVMQRADLVTATVSAFLKD